MKKIDCVILSGTKCSRRISTYLFTSVLLAFLAACGDDNSSSVAPNDEPSSSSVIPGSDPESSSTKELGNSSSSIMSSSDEVSFSSSSEKKVESSDSSGKSSSSDAPKSSSGETEVSSSSSQEEESSSSVIVSERWSWDVPKEYRLNPEVEYDSITDSRDGKAYKTVKIGDQTWMAENLNYADSVKTPSLLKRSWCYRDVAKNCDVAGRLYTWAAAMDSVKTGCGYEKICTLPVKVQGICPTGWHLPTNAEWSALFTAVGGQSTAGKVLKSQSGWKSYGNGSDAVGFSALPAGNGFGPDDFYREGYSSFFWSSTEDNGYSAYVMGLCCNDEDAYLISDFKGNGFSVRCVKD